MEFERWLEQFEDLTILLFLAQVVIIVIVAHFTTLYFLRHPNADLFFVRRLVAFVRTRWMRWRRCRRG